MITKAWGGAITITTNLENLKEALEDYHVISRGKLIAIIGLHSVSNPTEWYIDPEHRGTDKSYVATLLVEGLVRRKIVKKRSNARLEVLRA